LKPHKQYPSKQTEPQNTS